MADDALTALLAKSVAEVKAMTLYQREKMFEAQRRSWARGMTARCEHGELDFEQCPKCRSPSHDR